MDAIVQLVEEGQTNQAKKTTPSSKSTTTAAVTSVNLNWVSIESAGINYKGRFIPDTDYESLKRMNHLSSAAEHDFETWLRETTTLAVNTEINVQLGKHTLLHIYDIYSICFQCVIHPDSTYMIYTVYAYCNTHITHITYNIYNLYAYAIYTLFFILTICITYIYTLTLYTIYIGEFTIKKHATRPLEAEFRSWSDFKVVFDNISPNTVIQGVYNIWLCSIVYGFIYIHVCVCT